LVVGTCSKPPHCRTIVTLKTNIQQSMKKLCILTLALFCFSVLTAQNTDKGKQHLYYQRYHSAANTFLAVVEKEPKNDEALYGLVKAYVLQDELEKAKEALQQAPDAVKNDAFYLVAIGEVLLKENKQQEAANYFQQALDKTKNKNTKVMLAIAEAHNNAKTGDGAYAVELLNRALAREKKNPDPALYVALGDAYRKQQNSNEGYKAYREALNHNSDYAAALYRMGDIFLSQKNKEMYLNYFTQAVNADPAYAPALYRLYLYHFSYNPEKAMEYYNQYMANADKGLQNDYDLADLSYLNKDYNGAITKANNIIQQQGEKTKPRLYKLIGYSQAALKDSAKALQYMHRYFANESDSNYVAKDFEMLANLYLAQGEKVDSAVYAFTKAINLVQDSLELYPYYREVAELYKGQKDFAGQAKWMEQYYTGNSKATNVDLFNWALAHYMAEEYDKADKVFGLYVEKYPEQSFGYYWQARANAARDEGMKEGLAVPYYEKLIEVLQKEEMNETNKRWLTESYNYLAAYNTNTRKDYDEAIGYFEKVLELNPEDDDAKKYKAMLEKTAAGTGSR
jgi:tetratricopeptide (TPR) repeat protein